MHGRDFPGWASEGRERQESAQATRNHMTLRRLQFKFISTLERALSSAPVVVGVVMGSSSDWDTLRAATEILAEFGVAHEARVVSAHRMPDDMFRVRRSRRRVVG